MADVIKTGNYLYEHGFTMFSNLLIDYQDKLDLTNDDLVFILKVLRHKSGYKLHDSCLDKTLSTKTLQRRRKSLVEKGYLTFKVIKSNDENGGITTQGIVYDLTALEVALIQLSAEVIEKNAEIKVSKEVPKSEDPKSNNYFLDFQEEYKKRYGKEYILSTEEKLLLRSLKKEQKECIKYIFNYTDDNAENLPEGFHPRLSFFMKINWRMDKLMEYSNLKKELILEDLEEKKQAALESLAIDKYNSLFESKKIEKDFLEFLKKTTPSLNLRLKNSMMKNIIKDVEKAFVVYIEKGETNAAY